MFKIHFGLFMAFLVSLAATEEDCQCVVSMQTHDTRDDTLVDQLKIQLSELKINLAESKHKDELLQSLTDTIKLEKQNCNATVSNSVSSLKIKIKELGNLVSTYKKKLEAAQKMQSTKTELKECRAQLFLLQKEVNTNDQFTEPEQTPSNLGATSCASLNRFSGPRMIYLPGLSPISVMCDSQTAGPGWIIIQRRLDGSENFYRNWAGYRQGFGNPNGEFFIGLENLHYITNYEPCELYIHLEKFNGAKMFARYDEFLVGGEKSKYRLLKVGAMEGNAGDYLRSQENKTFSTYDNDNDNWEYGNAAVKYHGGWWYSEYTGPNLNGRYIFGNKKDKEGLHWNDLTTHKTVIMLIRPKI